MAWTFITYDLKETSKEIHEKVKNWMITKNLYIKTSPGGKYDLPNTTLVKSSITPAQAQADLVAAVKANFGTLERSFAADFTGEKFTG